MSRRLTAAAAAALLTVVLSACARTPREVPSSTPSVTTPPPTGSSPPGPTASPPPTTTGAPRLTTVTVTRTGGIAGVMQQVQIAPDGSWTYTDKRMGRVEHGKLDAAQWQELARLAADPGLMAEARQSPMPGRCSDAFIYAITVGELTLRYEQCGGPTSRPRTDALIALVLAATPL